MRLSSRKETTQHSRIEFDALDVEWLFSTLDPLPDAPVALVDIDSTIMNTAPRNRGILEAARRLFPQIEAVLSTLTEEDLGWGVAGAVARRAGLSDDDRACLEAFWAERFFSNTWVACDHPYDGVRSFLSALAKAGFHIVYLTGRDEPGMSEGTVRSFRSHELPTGTNTKFLFKPDASMDDIDFKRRVLADVDRIGTVVLCIDNEPGNANTFRRAFPDALVLLIDTITSPQPEPLLDGIHLFRRYP
ncbi:MAG: HAD family hydrolase [Spirochaetales bacterium]